MKTEDALDRILEGFQRLEKRLNSIEGRLGKVEEQEPAEESAATPADPPPLQQRYEGEEREDLFAPAVKKASVSRHATAVNKALSMLGLVPDAVDDTASRTATTGHQQAINKALNMLGMAPQQAEPTVLPAPTDQIELAREVAVPTLDPDELEAAEPGLIPLPEIDPAPAPAHETDEHADESESVDLGDAVAVDLERKKAGARDYAAAILNALVLVVAAGGAIYASGVLVAGGWKEIALGSGAVLCGAIALLSLQASVHVRAALGGVSVLLLHALLLTVLQPRLPLPAGMTYAACFLTSFLGVLVVMRTAHPLSLFLGFGVALALPVWLAPQAELCLPFVLAVNTAIGYGALRLNRLQATIGASILTTVLLMPLAASVAAWQGFILAGLYIVQVLAASFLARQQARAAALLALPAFGYFAGTVHSLYDGAAWIKIGALFALATAVGFVAMQLHRREELLRGVLKAGAVILLLSALPAGFTSANLAPFALFLALLFGVFALSLYDAYLRAVGSLTLMVAVALLLNEGPTAPMAFATAVVATVLYAVQSKGSDPRALRILLGALAHGAMLFAMARLLPAEVCGIAWLALAVAYQALARQFKVTFLEAGAAFVAGVAALWTVFLLPPDPVRLAITGAALVPHAWIAGPDRGRAGGLLLLAGELLIVAAVMLQIPGPLGVLASLMILPLLLAPWGAAMRETLRAHARFLTLVLLGRCLMPDVLYGDVARPWVNPRFLAMVACVVPALVTVRFATVGRGAAALLAIGILGAAVYLETHTWPLALVAAAVCGALCHFLSANDKPEEEEASEEEDVEEIELETPSSPD